MTFVMTSLDKIQAGFNSCFIVRYLLEKADNTEQAVSLLMELPIASNCNILLANKSGDMAVDVEPFGLSHRMTAKALGEIGAVGGPRCCKRDSYLSILAAVDFVKEHLKIEMEKQEIVCGYSAQNNQCIGKRCPFAKVNH